MRCSALQGGSHSGADSHSFGVFVCLLRVSSPQSLSVAESSVELTRLEKILKSLPTTEQQDREEIEKLKAAPGGLDWKKETVLLFRAERKRSLAYRIGKLQEKVGGGAKEL